MWTEDETKIIIKKFKPYIDRADKAPPLKECIGIFPNRLPKQVQDKVRTLIRQEKKKRSK